MSPSGFALGRHEFSRLNKSSCLPPNWAINVYCKIVQTWKVGYIDTVMKTNIVIVIGQNERSEFRRSHQSLYTDHLPQAIVLNRATLLGTHHKCLAREYDIHMQGIKFVLIYMTQNTKVNQNGDTRTDGRHQSLSQNYFTIWSIRKERSWNNIVDLFVTNM